MRNNEHERSSEQIHQDNGLIIRRKISVVGNKRSDSPDSTKKRVDGKAPLVPRQISLEVKVNPKQIKKQRYERN